MADDPYSKWLGLPPGNRPPKAHELLGLPANPTDATAIDAAAGRRMDQLDQYALSNDRATRSQVQQLINEVAKARTKLVGKGPKLKPKSKPKPVTPPPTGAPPQPTKQPKDQPAAKPVPQANGASPAPVAQLATAPAVTLESLPYAGSSSFSNQTKSAIVFWSLITMAWAATLAAVFAVTYISIAPQSPELNRDTVLAAVDRASDPAATEVENEQPERRSETQAPVPEPVSPTQEELAAQLVEQERLAMEKQAEQQRLALEQQRLAAQAEQVALAKKRREAEAVLERLEAERLAEADRAEQQRIKTLRKDYLAKRDRLTGHAKIRLIEEMLSLENSGFEIDIVAEYESGQLIGLDLSADYKTEVQQNKGNAMLKDLTPLAGLKLRKLNLEYCRKLTTLDGIQGMSLEWLNLRYCFGLQDISAIKGMPIEWLTMSDLKIPDLEPLRGMPLKYLWCMTCHNLTTTAPLAGIAIETIKLNACTKLADITGLESLNAAAGEVSLYNTPISDLSPLKGQRIGTLNLGKCDSIKTIDGLDGAVIGFLDLYHMDNLEDISMLRKIRVTDRLRLASKKVKSLSSLSNLQAKSVDINCDQVSSLRGLENLRNMEFLDIQHMDHIPRKEIERIKSRHDELRIMCRFRDLYR